MNAKINHMIARELRRKRMARLAKNVPIVHAFLRRKPSRMQASHLEREAARLSKLLRSDLRVHEKEIMQGEVPLHASRVRQYERLLALLL